MSEAWALWDTVCGDDRIAMLAEPEAIEPEFRRISALRSASPKVWAATRSTPCIHNSVTFLANHVWAERSISASLGTRPLVVQLP
jgi:hypothetical protein